MDINNSFTPSDVVVRGNFGILAGNDGAVVGVARLVLDDPATLPTPTPTATATPTVTPTPPQRTLYLPLVQR